MPVFLQKNASFYHHTVYTYISLLNKRFKKQSIIRVLKLTAAATVDQLISFKLRNRSELVTVDTRSKFRDYELLGQNLLLGLCH